MIEEEFRKKSGMRKVRCPLCAWRLCDAVVEEPDYIVSIKADFNNHFIMKCHKCGKQIGLTLIFKKIQNYTKNNIGT